MDPAGEAQVLTSRSLKDSLAFLETGPLDAVLAEAVLASAATDDTVEEDSSAFANGCELALAALDSLPPKSVKMLTAPLDLGCLQAENLERSTVAAEATMSAPPDLDWHHVNMAADRLQSLPQTPGVRLARPERWEAIRRLANAASSSKSSMFSLTVPDGSWEATAARSESAGSVQKPLTPGCAYRDARHLAEPRLQPKASSSGASLGLVSDPEACSQELHMWPPESPPSADAPFKPRYVPQAYPSFESPASRRAGLDSRDSIASLRRAAEAAVLESPAKPESSILSDFKQDSLQEASPGGSKCGAAGLTGSTASNTLPDSLGTGGTVELDSGQEGLEKGWRRHKLSTAGSRNAARQLTTSSSSQARSVSCSAQNAPSDGPVEGGQADGLQVRECLEQAQLPCPQPGGMAAATAPSPPASRRPVLRKLRSAAAKAVSLLKRPRARPPPLQLPAGAVEDKRFEMLSPASARGNYTVALVDGHDSDEPAGDLIAASRAQHAHSQHAAAQTVCGIAALDSCADGGQEAPSRAVSPCPESATLPLQTQGLVQQADQNQASNGVGNLSNIGRKMTMLDKVERAPAAGDVSEIQPDPKAGSANKTAPSRQHDSLPAGPPTPEAAERIKRAEGARLRAEQRATSAVSLQHVGTGGGGSDSSCFGVAVREDGGNRYEGQVGSSTIEGHGLMLFSGGGSYAGQWLDSQYWGNGIEMFPDGSHYVGHFQRGTQHGTGTCYYTDGTVYAGEWEDGLQHGLGHQDSRQERGFFYVGSYYQGRRQGLGVAGFDASGEEYLGEMRDDAAHGYGVAHLGSRRGTYEGQWMSGKRHGWAVTTLSDGNMWAGQWVFGRASWLARLRVPNSGELGDQYQEAMDLCEEAARLARAAGEAASCQADIVRVPGRQVQVAIHDATRAGVAAAREAHLQRQKAQLLCGGATK